MAKKVNTLLIAVETGIICATFAYLADTQGFTLNIIQTGLWSTTGALMSTLLGKVK
jgi:hypothetical protein